MTESFLYKFLKLYHKEDIPVFGRFKMTHEEVADALGYADTVCSNGKPYCRRLVDMINDNLVEDRDNVVHRIMKDNGWQNICFLNKQAPLILATISPKNQNGPVCIINHEALMMDYSKYIDKARKQLLTTMYDQLGLCLQPIQTPLLHAQYVMSHAESDAS